MNNPEPSFKGFPQYQHQVLSLRLLRITWRTNNLSEKSQINQPRNYRNFYIKTKPNHGTGQFLFYLNNLKNGLPESSQKKIRLTCGIFDQILHENSQITLTIQIISQNHLGSVALHWHRQIPHVNRNILLQERLTALVTTVQNKNLICQ